MKKTRIPTQKRALEKYEKIIAAANTLFNEKGYFATTTTDIAKESGVAVGSIYSYFADKKEIYIIISNRIMEKITTPVKDFWLKNKTFSTLDEKGIKSIFKLFIYIMMKEHDFSKIFHEDMKALSILDEDISKLSLEHEKIRKDRARQVLDSIQIPFKNENSSEVFLHYCNLLIDDVCHTIIYEDQITNKDLYVDQAVDLLYKLLQNLANL